MGTVYQIRISSTGQKNHWPYSHSGVEMTSLDDTPSEAIVSREVWMEDDNVRRKILEDISSHIVDTHIDLTTAFKQPQDKAGAGTVYDYACEALGLGLLIMDFKDAVREGDGNRIMSLWKYLLLLFKASGRKNYAIEALTLLSQYSIILPPNLAEQLKWSRFVNMHGRPGHNISCDLHMEYLSWPSMARVPTNQRRQLGEWLKLWASSRRPQSLLIPQLA